jgi:chemotaxis protein MotB
MLRSTRASICLLAGALALGPSGCNMVPNNWLRQSALKNRDLYQQTQALNQQAAQLAAENARAQEALAAERQRAELARQQAEAERQRNANLDAERKTLHNKYVSLLDRTKKLENPLSAATNQKFADLVKKYPGFNFDPETGVSKFSSDVLFDSGSATVKPSAKPLLSDFARIMNEGDAKRLGILVVGHTDDKPIKKASTASKHPTNWHLSTNRANEVLVSLEQYGIGSSRMGASGYGMQQPLVPNSSDQNRSQNRRVEIFVLAPEATIAGRDSFDSSLRK